MPLDFANVLSGLRQLARSGCREPVSRISSGALVLGCACALTPGVAVAQPVPPEPFALGRGVPLGSTGVRLGGYAAIELEKAEKEPTTFLFDDLSLFVFGDLATRGRFFIEIEDSKFWRVRDGTSAVDHHPDLERLYVDYLHGDALKVRVGKFLTPIGTWNEIHPDPLTWTVSRPIATHATFPTFVTGVQVFGTRPGDSVDVDYVVFGQANPCIDCNTNDRETERAVGGRVRWRFQAVEIGVPALRYVDRLTEDRVTLTGADLLARHGALEVRAEATIGGVTRRGSATTSREYAWYLQGLYALSGRCSLVVRGERARSSNREIWASWSAGVLVRPLPAMSVKLEFQDRRGTFPTDEAERGQRLLASFGVLF